MDEKFANNPFRDSLRAINKENLPKKGTQGRDAADRLKASRRHRKKADVEYDRECELFLQAMDGTGMQPDQGKDADNAFFLAEVDSFPVTATQKKGAGNKKTGKAGTEASRRTAGRTVHSATSVRPEATHAAARKETASADSVPLQDEKDPDQEEDKSMSELLASDETDPAFARAMQGVSPLNKSGREVIPAVASRPGPVQAGNALQDFMDGCLMRGSIQMEYFLHGRPPFSFRPAFERLLARLAEGPPALRLGVSCHLGHVGSIIVAGIFVVAEQIAVLVVDAIVLQVALFDHFLYRVPNGSVQPLVLFQAARSHLDYTSITLYHGD